MQSSSRVRSLAVMSPLAFALAFAASAQAATRVDLHHQDVAGMYRQYKAASARIAKIPLTLSRWIAAHYLPHPNRASEAERRAG